MFSADICYACRGGMPVSRTLSRCLPRLYAVWFQPVKLLKIGKTTQTGDYTVVWNARQRAKRSDGKLIWTQPGDIAEEAFMQSYFALRGYSPSKSFKGHRVSEWLLCPDDTEQSLVQKLDSIYDYIRKIKDHD